MAYSRIAMVIGAVSLCGSAFAQAPGESSANPNITITESGKPPVPYSINHVGIRHVVGGELYTLTPVSAPVPAPPDGAEGTGTCKLRFGVDRRGNTNDVKVTCPSRRYARIITQAARDWTFEPIEHRGRIREADNVYMTIDYRIETEAF